LSSSSAKSTYAEDFLEKSNPLPTFPSHFSASTSFPHSAETRDFQSSYAISFKNIVTKETIPKRKRQPKPKRLSDDSSGKFDLFSWAVPSPLSHFSSSSSSSSLS
jgi:hypothetical protein